MKYYSHFILISIIFSLVACKASQNLKNESSLKDQNEDALEFVAVELTDEEESIQFTIKNLTEENIFLSNNERVYIEKEINGVWKKLRILPCPCGAPCAQPENEIKIPANKSYIISWNKMESWCGERNEKGIPTTESKAVNNGKYRIRLGVKKGSSEFKIIYKEFNI